MYSTLYCLVQFSEVLLPSLVAICVSHLLGEHIRLDPQTKTATQAASVLRAPYAPNSLA